MAGQMKWCVTRLASQERTQVAAHPGVSSCSCPVSVPKLPRSGMTWATGMVLFPQSYLERQDLSCTYLAHHELESILLFFYCYCYCCHYHCCYCCCCYYYYCCYYCYFVVVIVIVIVIVTVIIIMIINIIINCVLVCWRPLKMHGTQRERWRRLCSGLCVRGTSFDTGTNKGAIGIHLLTSLLTKGELGYMYWHWYSQRGSCDTLIGIEFTERVVGYICWHWY